MKFNFKALDSEGKEVTDTLEADTQKEAITKIRNMGYFPVNIKNAEDKRSHIDIMAERAKKIKDRLGLGDKPADPIEDLLVEKPVEIPKDEDEDEGEEATSKSFDQLIEDLFEGIGEEIGEKVQKWFSERAEKKQALLNETKKTNELLTGIKGILENILKHQEEIDRKA